MKVASDCKELLVCLCDVSQVNGLWSYSTLFFSTDGCLLVASLMVSQGGGNVRLSVLFVQCDARRSGVQKVCRSFSPIQIRSYGNKSGRSQISIKVV